MTRHGETEENKKGILMGHHHGKLSALGIKQAQLVAERLRDEHIDYIYSSDLNRSANTAKAIAAYHNNTPLILTEALRERYLGFAQGKSKEELGLKQDQSAISFFEREDCGIESTKEIFERADKFLHEIVRKHPSETVLVVGHNGINKALMAAVRRDSPEEMLKRDNFHNTSITILDIDEGGNHTIHVDNCVKHFENKPENAND
jgi:broad specificity phosphatase PhoE